jgi:hypothetical protein
LGGLYFEASLVNSYCGDLISTITTAKWTGGVAQVVKRLLCKCEVLGYAPVLAQKRYFNSFIILDLEPVFLNDKKIKNEC